MPKTKKLEFEKAMEIGGINPLHHYYEEIYPNLYGLKKIGLRGDKNYLLYSCDNRGAGYYEKHEEELSAKSVYDFFASAANKKKFFTGIEHILKTVQTWIKNVESIDLTHLTDQQVAAHLLKSFELHGWIFSYFTVSQPYRIRLFEAAIKQELAKRVATSKVDSYLTILATTEKSSKIAHEELDWLKLLIATKKKYGASKLYYENLEKRHPDILISISQHFEKYKVLTLGDGNWSYDLSAFVKTFRQDYKKNLAELEERYKTVKYHSQEVLNTRLRLVEELYLDKQTVELIEFLAEVGHTRLMLRIEGWIPLVALNIELDIELSKRLDVQADTRLNFMTPKELEVLVSTGKMVAEQILIERQGKHEEFLVLNDNGKCIFLYGPDAGKRFKQLVPTIDHTQVSELTGSTGVQGHVKGRACVFKWGDDMNIKMSVIKKNPILVAGQTRPAMMPLIRLAKGIITDEGGVTSHAAIVSRELGIPSVIGTIYATQVFADGDMVELDATNSVVRKLK